jgi:hypothetical protein
MMDCCGVISIWERWNDRAYPVEDNRDPGPIIAQIKSVDDFIVQGDQMYLIDVTPKGICNNLVPGKYCGDFQVKGQSKAYYYDGPDQVPTYLVIDTKTGDERFYANVNDAPQSDRAIFQSLLTR